MKKLFLVLAVFATSISCSKVEKVEQNMDTLRKNTEQMSTTTEGLQHTTAIMYQQLRSKESEETRNEKFQLLNSKDERFGSRITAAAVFFSSFEFQLWSAQKGFDNFQIRDLLLLDASNEFVKRICDIYDQINLKRMGPIKQGKHHSAEMSFYALALTMHMKHIYQEELSRTQSNFKVLSFYDVIKNALMKDHNNEPMYGYEEVLVSGHNKEIMIELIKARVDVISMLALRNLTDVRDMTINQKLKGAIFKITKGNLGSIDLPDTYSKTNAPTVQQTIQFLGAANDDKSFLKSIQTDKELEKTLKSAYSKIQSNNRTQEDKNLLPNREEIMKLIDKLIL